MFVPKRIIFLEDSLKYEMGRNVYNFFKDNEHVKIYFENSNNVKPYFDQENFGKFYAEGKRTLILGVKRVGPFQTCKPSADYQLPLVSGCMGQCEYCYLQTQLKDYPYMKLNVNLEDILDKAKIMVNDNEGKITTFEGAATSDVLPVEPYTKVLSRTIEFFGELDNGRFRFVSKFTDVDTLLNIKHNNHTEIRFTINPDSVIRQYEHATPPSSKRIEAAKKVLDAGYRVGFLIAPVFLYDQYQEDYLHLLMALKEEVAGYEDKLTFEIISHHFTPKAKEAILSIFPDSALDMDEEKRTYRMGQFGYGKYMYKNDELKEMKGFFKESLQNIFPKSEVLYII